MVLERAGGGSKMSKSCVCCKKYWDHLKMKCFIRQMIANFKHGMMIPEKFRNHFMGQFSGIIKLEAPNGNVYDVGVSKQMNEIVLRAGWEVFVDACHIEEYDTLLFQYSGNSRFKVLIFDSSDCEKVSLCISMRNAPNVQESEDPVHISTSPHHHTNQLPSERLAGCWRGSSSHCRKTAKTASTFSPFKESGDDSPSEYESSSDIQTSSERGYVLSARCYLTEAQEAKVAARVQEIRPEIPMLVTLMNKTCVNGVPPSLVISKDYAAAHFPRESQTITLQRLGKSKKWHPRLYVRKDGGRMLYGRWSEFVRDNRVQEGDICIFEPMKDERRFTLAVHLLREASTRSPSRAGLPREKIYICCSKHGKRATAQEHLDVDVSEGPSVPAYMLSGSLLTPAQEEKVEEQVRAIRSKVPIYVAIMNKCTVGCRALAFGMRYATAYLPDRRQTMALQRTSKSKIWHTTLHVNSNHVRMLVQGWHEFVRDNNLRVGDICLFQLMKNDAMLTMMVHLVRKDD